MSVKDTNTCYHGIVTKYIQFDLEYEAVPIPKYMRAQKKF